ncbi:MAG: SDR family oxidoreductase [Acidobacteria bacterium]|nr:SDR family oxidoreductase [Acidobacteriota bacterium]
MKVSLITGASSGIGEAFARRLAAEGHDLLLVARSETKLAALCEELRAADGVSANYVAIDLTDYEADRRLYEETERHGLQVDWLINNAGFGSMGDFIELDLERELEMIGLNVMALVALTHRYLPGMRQRKSGTIINVSSTASYQPVPYMATYAATKAFVTSFSQAIAEENRRDGILVQALCPGPTETAFFDTAKIEPTSMFKQQQTAEDVVEAAMRAVASGKTKAISGWMNRLVATASLMVPDRLITNVVGKAIGPKFRSKK